MDYVRDGRSPIPKSETVSKVMSANRGKDTKPEIALRKNLRKAGIPGYRIHWKKAPGKPDISYPKHKVAIFVHGCFWHRCPYCKLSLPKSNTKFWRTKFKRNQERDIEKKRRLEKEGWKVFVFWECMIKEDVVTCAQQIKDYLENL